MPRTFSLCQTVKHLEKENLILFRLADKDLDKLCEFRPFEQYNTEYPEARRRNNPYTSDVNHQINELKIWEWDPDESSWAKKTNIPFYELSLSTDLIFDNENDIITKLKSGIDLPEYNGQRLFVKISENEDAYEVIALDSSKMKLTNGIAKINETALILKGYYLKKDDLINTEKIMAFSSDGGRLQSRYVYKYLELQEADFEIQIKTFVEKLELWFKKQIKLKGFSKKEIKASRELFLESLSSYDEIKEFFEQNGFDDTDIKKRIEEVKVQIQDILSENNQYDIFCERMIEALPILTEKFESEVEKKWLKKHKFECEKAQQEIIMILKQKSKNEFELRAQNEKIILLQDEAIIIENKIKEMNNIEEKLQTSIRSRIVDIKSNISDFFSEAVLYQSLFSIDKIDSLPLNVETQEANKSNKIIQLFSAKLKAEAEVLNSDNDFMSVLEINLEMAGALGDITSNLSQYITACITQKTPLILVGYGSRNVADAISATICGMTSDVITLTGVFDDYEILSKMIVSCQSDVVIIENAIGYIDESIYMKIIKDTHVKTLLFGIEFSEQLNFIPKSIMNYVNILSLDDICDRRKQGEYNGAIINDHILIYTKDLKGLRINKEAANEVSRLIGMPKIYNSLRAELLTTMDSYYNPSAMFSWLIFEVVPYMVSVGKNQEASQLVYNKELNEQQNKILISILKSEEI